MEIIKKQSMVETFNNFGLQHPIALLKGGWSFGRILGIVM